jgi:O-antigen/teichoic acid export membrane protein
MNLLLARVGPETLGTYGLLSVYIALSSAFLYFGGDAVVMRFIPECRSEDRASFLVSYLLIIVIAIGGWLTFVRICPVTLRLVFGKSYDSRFSFLLLCCSIVPIGFSMVVAALKGMLDIRVSQLLAKALTVCSLVAYTAFVYWDRTIFLTHPTVVIWIVYLGLSAVLGFVGLGRLVRLCSVRRLRWYLPSDFWRYAVNTQQVSVVSFLGQKLDYLLIANFGGLKLLGQYVAVNAIASIIPVLSGIFMDTLLPALTNTLAARNYAGATQVFAMHMRILFFAITATTCAVMLLAIPATAAMGNTYKCLGVPIIMLALAYGVGFPGSFGGIILAAVGRQNLGIWALSLNTLILVCIFFPLWRQFHLVGAVLACSVALVVSNIALMIIALRAARAFPSMSAVWIASAAVQGTVSFTALRWMPLGIVSAAWIWIGAMAVFVCLASYSSHELIDLGQTLFPGFGRRLSENDEESASEPGEQAIRYP